MARKDNILLFPFMAQGHIIPFLSLAMKLQEKGFTITFVNTPLNINKLRKNLPINSQIRLIDIPFDSAKYGLPPSTENLSPPLLLRLIEASPSLRPAFRALVSRLADPPVCVISDIFFAWSADVAHEFGAFHAVFHAAGGYGTAGFHATWQNLPHRNPDSEEFRLPGFPKNYYFKTKNLPQHVQMAEGEWKFALDMFQDWKKTDAMLFNTVEDFDHTGLTYFRQQFPGCSVYAIGPILVSSRDEEIEPDDECMKWLDSKPEKSVLYVAFGSQSSPSEPQILELAKALEGSNVNFLWVVRPPSSFITENNTIKAKKDWLPNGFQERIQASKKGFLLKKWAPQMEILSHNSIGAFLTHCGWNSTLEALSNGVPLLSWPMGAEQPFNAQLLEEEMRLCVSVANGMGVVVKHEDIVEKIELIMNNEQGSVMRGNAFKVKEIIENATIDEECRRGSSVKALDDFLNTLLHIKAKVSFYWD